MPYRQLFGPLPVSGLQGLVNGQMLLEGVDRPALFAYRGLAVLGHPNLKVDVIESEEGPALGGAMLAAVACGEYESVEAAAAKIVKIIDTVEPEPELVAKYEERYQQFKEIYPACKPLFEIIK